MGCCQSSRRGAVYDRLISHGNYQTRGNEENAEMLISYYLRQEEDDLEIHIPKCINYICLKYFYESTNVIFCDFDKCQKSNVSISEQGKKIKISSNTIFVFSDIGYSSGYHSWSVKLFSAYTCQALGIAEYQDSTYRYGYNIFDSELNRQLGDRYIYAGDTNHGWRGSTEMRPYVMSAEGSKMKYDKKLKLRNNKWQVGDIITVEFNANGDQWWIVFKKNGKYLCDKIKIKNQKMYFPVFQVYQRGTFQIVDDYTYEMEK